MVKGFKGRTRTALGCEWRRLAAASTQTDHDETPRERVSLVSVRRLEYGGEWPILYFIS
jgi:hypothetical protein